VVPDDEASYRGSMPRNAVALQAWHASAETEQALEPELPIVDPHHHLFGTGADPHYYRMQELAHDLTAGHRVIGTVYMEAYQSGWRSTGPESLRSVGEIDMILRVAADPLMTAHGPCQIAAAIVSSVDLTRGDDVVPVLEAHLEAAHGRLRGVRHHLATDDGLVGRFIKQPPRPHLLRDPAFRKGYAQLSRFDLSFDAWLYHNQLGELAEIADTSPDVHIVVNHVGTLIGVGPFRPRRNEELAAWRRDLRTLAARPNVVLKIGGMGMPVYGFGFEHGARPATSAVLLEAWRPFIETAVEIFGTQRCMFESNFPPDKQSCSYVALWNAFKRATRALSPAERSDLFHRTACRTYRLPGLEALADQSATQQH